MQTDGKREPAPSLLPTSKPNAGDSKRTKSNFDLTTAILAA